MKKLRSWLERSLMLAMLVAIGYRIDVWVAIVLGILYLQSVMMQIQLTSLIEVMRMIVDTIKKDN